MPLVIDETLRAVCNSSPEELCVGFKEITVGARTAYFKDNHSSILAVAHLDTVNAAGKTWGARIELDVEVFFSPYLDDRLGAYTILHVLPEAFKIKPDILFTLDEEKRATTANLFQTGKQYNWIVEFDRRGEDVVLYGYKNVAFEAKLEGCGFKTGFGSFSDISALEFLKCKGFNVGVGYQEEHSAYPYFELDVYDRQLLRFAKFHDKFKDVHFPHEKKIEAVATYANYFGRYGMGAMNAYGSNFPEGDTGAEWANKVTGYGHLSKKQRKRMKAIQDSFSPGVNPGLKLNDPPSWCPSCYRRTIEGCCPTCGPIVEIGVGQWWPVNKPVA